MQNVSEWLIRRNSEVLNFLLQSGFSVERLQVHPAVEKDDKECLTCLQCSAKCLARSWSTLETC